MRRRRGRRAIVDGNGREGKRAETKGALGVGPKRRGTAGRGEAAQERINDLLVGPANRGAALFQHGYFAMPDAQGRNHILALEDGDGMGLYLTIGLPGKEAAPHDHGIWCVNAAISGREVHRRTDDGSRDGYATIEPAGEAMVAPGQGMAMADHAIHET